MPLPVATMPLRSVTSVKRSAVRPFADSSFRNKPAAGTWNLSDPGSRIPNPECRALNSEHVEIAVVVEVDQRPAGADDFRQEEFPGGTVDMNEVETRLRGRIDKRCRRLSTHRPSRPHRMRTESEQARHVQTSNHGHGRILLLGSRQYAVTLGSEARAAYGPRPTAHGPRPTAYCPVGRCTGSSFVHGTRQGCPL